MDINLNNYEEFFILYMDDELPIPDRIRVEQFVAGHPELKQELDLLKQTRFSADDSVTFDAKDSLLRVSEDATITEGNQETWLLSYIDNELTPEQRKMVEDFAATRSSVQKELTLLQLSKLDPADTIVFADKKSLYRKEEKSGRIVYFSFRRVAVAAAILLAVSTTVWMLNNKKEDGGQELAGTEKVAEKVKKDNAPVQLPVPGAETTTTLPKEELAVVPQTQKTEVGTPARANDKPKSAVQQKTQADEVQLVAKKDVRPNGNNLPSPANNPNVKDESTSQLAVNDITVPQKPLTTLKDINKGSTVTPDRHGALDNVIAANVIEPSDDVIDQSTEPGRKNKLRGFFRKITRTFEKTTNIKATTDDDRLLVGGLAIRL